MCGGGGGRCELVIDLRGVSVSVSVEGDGGRGGRGEDREEVRSE